jgi:hypothetical protein
MKRMTVLVQRSADSAGYTDHIDCNLPKTAPNLAPTPAMVSEKSQKAAKTSGAAAEE